MCGFLSFKHGRNYFFASFSARASQTEPRSSAVKKPSFSLFLTIRSRARTGIGQLQLDGDLARHVGVADLLRLQDLQHHDVGICHRTVIYQIVLAHEGRPL